MNFLIVKNDIDTSLLQGENVLEKIREKVMESMSEDMRACFFSGVPMDTTFENNTLTIRTKYPVSILKTPDGKIIDIKYKKDEKDRI